MTCRKISPGSFINRKDMEFRKLDVKDYPEFLKMYNATFPENERRLYKSAEHVANFVHEKGGKFRGFAFDDGGDDFLGFLTYWVFKGYVYIEHFAVDPAHRCKNVGSKMLSHLFDIEGPDVLVEVEKPDTPDAERRIKFYERNGFKLREDINYVQPPYSAEQSGVEMMLMTHGDVKLRDTRDLREMLTEVYNVENSI